MTNTKPFLLGVATATVTLAVGVFVGMLLNDAPQVTAPSGDDVLSPRLDGLTRAIEDLARGSRTPLRASTPAGATSGAAAPTDGDPQPLDVGPSREDLAAQVAMLRARIAGLETSGGGSGPTFRPDGADGEPIPRIAMQRDVIEELLALEDDELLGEILLLTQRQVYERLGGPSRITKKDEGLTWFYTPDTNVPNRLLLVTFNDGVVTSFYARR